MSHKQVQTLSQDRVFSDRETTAGSFEFDESVAAVFPDMLRRSIPGYEASLEAIRSLARRYVTADSTCYDLGCSLGAATLAMRHGIAVDGCEIVAVDLAPAMVARCRAIVDRDSGTVPVSVLESDIRDVEIANASMVVLNYTLQFLPVGDRDETIRNIHDGLSPGGVFVLSEKVAHADPKMDELLIELYHDFKRDNDYSDLEIARKRTALENVLIPETVDEHLERLRRAGFSHCDVWMKHLNFVSILAVR